MRFDFIMKKSQNLRKLLITCFFIQSFFTFGLFADSDKLLPSNLVAKVKNSVYEVIVPKLKDGDITYEKELPMHLVPYAIRTDKYYSIGSAFKISGSKFVSASHVMILGEGSQYNKVLLRDQSGKVYDIDKIEKYSDHRDFVIFTVKENTAADYLNVNKDPAVNSKVYAVGNAHGEGVIIRDGLLTSETPEEENGEWKWLRFSAAASPGNSGGPLLDAKGNVIGIVLRKSENENLNYALPIKEAMDAKDNLAVSHKKFGFGLDNMDKVDYDTYDFSVKLPMSYDDLNAALMKDKKSYIERLTAKSVDKYSKIIFPNGEKSEQLLYSNYITAFPHLIAQSKDSYWSTYKPSDIRTSDLKDNGYIQYGSLNSYYLMYIKAPESIKLKDFLTDSKLFMDTILTGVSLSRNISSESVRVLSLGKAEETSTYVDKYNRKWIVNSWKVTYSDEKILTYSLPVPGGTITMLRMGSTGKIDMGISVDMRIMTDFIYYSYYGTFKEWQEFIGLKQYLPGEFSGVSFSYAEGKNVEFKSKRFNSGYDSSLMDITDDSDLEVVFTYFRDKGKVVWDISGLIWGKNKSSQTAFSIIRTMKPADTLKESYQDEWKKIVEEKFPYNKTPYPSSGKTIISGLYPKYAKEKGSSFVYTATYSEEGNLKAEQAEKMIKRIFDTVHINE